jgi:tRNA wybutosine-synthesizing protein 3
MTNRFQTRKQNILAQLDAPDGEYHDLSPKGSVDEPIRDLISEINAFDGFVTTSSCSGRTSVFLEGRKSGTEDTLNEEHGVSRAGPGGKGGGAWLFISHALVDLGADESSTIFAKLGLDDTILQEGAMPGLTDRYIHLKFEPMVSSMPAVVVVS